MLLGATWWKLERSEMDFMRQIDGNYMELTIYIFYFIGCLNDFDESLMEFDGFWSLKGYFSEFDWLFDGCGMVVMDFHVGSWAQKCLRGLDVRANDAGDLVVTKVGGRAESATSWTAL